MNGFTLKGLGYFLLISRTLIAPEPEIGPRRELLEIGWDVEIGLWIKSASSKAIV
jgi:hypothetical protein